MSRLDWALLILGVGSFSFSGWVFFSLFLPRIPSLFPARTKARIRIKIPSIDLSSAFQNIKRVYETRRRMGKIRELFPQAVGMAVQALKVGQTLPQVIEYLSRECPEPLAVEFAQTRAEMDLGAPVEGALANMSERSGSFQEFEQFLECYRVSRRTGASLARLLEVLLEGLEEKNRLLRKMDAMTAQARLSGLMMGFLPVVLALVFFFMDPALLLPLFTQSAGWAILALALLLETVGFLWIRHILRLEV